MNPNALDTLRDIHLPEATAWWATTEIWVAAACVGVAASWMIFRAIRYRRLRHALRELSALEAAHARDGNAVRLAGGVSQLLRRHATACFPDAGVDGLSGGEWLAFLDARSGGKAFTEGPGAVLESLPYRASGTADTSALIALVRQWLRENPR